MKTPVDGARISSGFGTRKHPVLGYTRMHKGLDFAAPRGTPIYASGDGSITYMGINGGYGNFVTVRHNSEFSTNYAHMNHFKRGLKLHQKVKQGDIIGYVGTTGLSTGPHLHYEIVRNGVKVNPATQKFASNQKITSTERVDFNKMVDRMNELARSSEPH